MKKIIKPFLLIYIPLFVISLIPVAGVSRPAYALSETDSFIVDNDYELLTEDSYTVGTIDSYWSVWVKPSDCYPPDVSSPPCTGAFGAEYNADSDADQYDESYYNAIRLGLSFTGFEEITDEVPGAGLAYVYNPAPGLYSAIAYFGEKTGIFVVVAEYTIATMISGEDLISAPSTASYSKEGMEDILVNIGEKVADELNLPGFEFYLTAGALVTMFTLTVIYRRKKQ